MSAFVIGSTGLCGSQILKNAVSSGNFGVVNAISRRGVEGNDKINSIIETDSTKWPDIIRKQGKGVSVFFSGFGTTRADAGGIENFKKIDYGTNLECAKAARDAGIETFVLVSSGGASEGSFFPYLKIKGELENRILELKFPRTIILRPGILLGKREKSKGVFTDLATSVGNAIKSTPFRFIMYPISGEDVGKTAVNLANEPFNKSDSEVVKIVGGGELIDLANSLN